MNYLDHLVSRYQLSSDRDGNFSRKQAALHVQNWMGQKIAQQFQRHLSAPLSGEKRAEPDSERDEIGEPGSQRSRAERGEVLTMYRNMADELPFEILQQVMIHVAGKYIRILLEDTRRDDRLQQLLQSDGFWQAKIRADFPVWHNVFFVSGVPPRQFHFQRVAEFEYRDFYKTLPELNSRDLLDSVALFFIIEQRDANVQLLMKTINDLFDHPGDREHTVIIAKTADEHQRLNPDKRCKVIVIEEGAIDGAGREYAIEKIATSCPSLLRLDLHFRMVPWYSLDRDFSAFGSLLQLSIKGMEVRRIVLPKSITSLKMVTCDFQDGSALSDLPKLLRIQFVACSASTWDMVVDQLPFEQLRHLALPLTDCSIDTWSQRCKQLEILDVDGNAILQDELSRALKMPSLNTLITSEANANPEMVQSTLERTGSTVNVFSNIATDVVQVVQLPTGEEPMLFNFHFESLIGGKFIDVQGQHIYIEAIEFDISGYNLYLDVFYRNLEFEDTNGPHNLYLKLKQDQVGEFLSALTNIGIGINYNDAGISVRMEDMHLSEWEILAAQSFTGESLSFNLDGINVGDSTFEKFDDLSGSWVSVANCQLTDASIPKLREIYQSGLIPTGDLDLSENYFTPQGVREIQELFQASRLHVNLSRQKQIGDGSRTKAIRQSISAPAPVQIGQ